MKGVPIMHFDERFVDFGKVKKGEKRSHVYKFTNIGDVPLEIEIASSCDCTTLEYPTKPIKPGEKGEVKAIFDSTEKKESETTSIDIILKNTEPDTGNPIFEKLKYHFDLVK